MDYLPLRIRFNKLLQAADYQGIRRLLTDNPEFLNDPTERADMMSSAARTTEHPNLLALLHEMGIGLDTGRPIYSAAATNQWDRVHWLVEHGAEINWKIGDDSLPVCWPLATAIRAGRLDVVKLLVEHGAVLDVCDRRHLTPLAWAVNYGQKEIADYLRSKGAVMPEQARNYLSRSAIQVHLNDTFNEPEKLDWPPALKEEPPIITHCVLNIGFLAAITEGMSARAMNVPPGYENDRFAELIMPLSEVYWPTYPEAPKAWLQEQYIWAIEWLHRLTRYPFEHNTWLGEPKLIDPSPIIPNGEPPQPLSPYTKMTCWLMLPDKDLDGHPVPRAKQRDGTEVVFYTVMAIHTAERDYARQRDLRALLEKFAEVDLDVQLDPNRPSVV